MNYEPKSLPPEEINNPTQNPYTFLVKAISVLSLVLVCFYLASYFVPPVLTALTPRTVERKFGDVLLRTQMKDRVKPDGELLAIWSEMREALPEKLRDVELYILTSSSENAFAAPGNKIFLTSKFIKNAETENEKIFVIGHELGHQYYRHPMKSVYSKLLSSAVVSMITGSNSFPELMFAATSKAFDRGQEKQADMFALDLVQRVSGNASGAFEFFKRMSRKYGKLEFLNGGVFSTHPLSKKRVKYLETACVEKFTEEACL